MLKKNTWMSLLCALFILVSLLGPTMAVEENITLSEENDSATATINEFEFVSNLSKQSEKSLKISGFSDDDIKIIKNYDNEFKKHIKLINETYSDDELIGFGYTKNEVELIRNFDSSAKTSADLAANMTVKFTILEPLKYNSSKNETTIKVKYEYQWTRLPVWAFTDSFALGWNDINLGPNTSIHTYGYSPVTINYYKGSTLTKSVSGSSSVDGFYGTKYQFPMQISSAPQSHAMNGIGTVSLKRQGDVSDVRFHIYYVHSKAVLTYSFTIGALGISFSTGGNGVDSNGWEFRVSK
ncbi:hypothetical protein [Methanolapillus ohkumae]|uniref:Uncharacterized protein n=1 Tax=Methanolapillus ohkumae TaxID=3028298 RepID=A0AA96V746_9EURY|nr:hypothetical protein MsAm2_15910 [Methanosarcinaceae archaeon Am2]